MKAKTAELPRANAELLADLCDNASDLIVVVDAESRLLYWNRAWSVVLGYRDAELSGRPIFEFIAADCLSDCERRFSRVAHGEVVDGVEAQFVARHGGVIVVEGVCSGTFEDGVLQYVRAIFRDITAKRRAELEREDLLQKEHAARLAAELAHEQLADIFERVTDAFVALDPEWRYTYVNAKAGELFGRKPEDLIGRYIWDEFPEGIGQPFHQSYLRAAAEQRPIEMEDYYAPWDRWFENRIFPSPKGISIYFHEITARKRAEAALHKSEVRFRRLSESGMIGIVIAKISGEVVEANDVYLEMIGYTRPELERGEVRWRTMTPPEWAPADDRAIVELQERGVCSLFEKEFFRKDGSRVAILLGVALIEGGEEGECISFVLDITPQKKVEQELAESAEQLRALAARVQSLREEERTRVARELHDEFGSSLTALKMNLAAIDRRLVRVAQLVQIAEMRTRLEETLREIDALGEKVRQICTELRPGVLDQLGITAAVQWQAAEFQARSGIVCELERADSVFPITPPAAIALFRIFQEILTNVGRHSGASKVGVRLTQEDGIVTLSVRDNGRGIAHEALAGHHGLGIVGMRERAVAVGGNVVFLQPETGGTLVSVTVPVTPPTKR